MQKVLLCLCLLVAACSAQQLAFKLAAGVEKLINHIDTSFTCADKEYGYYADIKNECKIFHVCLPVENEVGKAKTMEMFSFICGNATVFNQESLTCTSEEDAVPCAQAESLYQKINSLFGKLYRARSGQAGQGQSGFATDIPAQAEDTTQFGRFQG